MTGHGTVSAATLRRTFLAASAALLPVLTAAPGRGQTTAPAISSDYGRRYVAYINESEAVTRQQLGEYLIDRCGEEKLDLLINRRIVESACRQRNIEVQGGEVVAAVAEDMKGMNIDRERFMHDMLKAVHKNLYEWKEDIIRPKLLLTKLCRDQITVSEDEINDAFDSAYGEKVECRIIIWPPDQEDQAKSQYSALRSSEDAFAVAAKNQWKGNLAATGGKMVQPIAHGSFGNAEVEHEAFSLRPGEVSKLLTTPEGIMLLKCDRRIPADTTVNRDAVHEKLFKEVQERKVLKQLPIVFTNLRKQAAIKRNLPLPGSPQDTPASREPWVVVATINGSDTITREDLGEFLIARYGVERVELLVNHIILDEACKARGVTCSSQEIEAELQKDLDRMHVDRKGFADKILKERHITMFEWTEDVLKSKILLSKMCRDRIKISDDDLRKAFQAYHGEAIRGRFILWPKGEERAALLEYQSLRDDEKAFDHKARTQASSTLAAKGGDLGPIRRYTTGDEQLEREIFSLQPGELSRIIGTAEGTVVFKCDALIPADSKITLASVREDLSKTVFERKIQDELARMFAELRAAAKPHFVLKDQNKPVDLKSEVEPELKNLKVPLKLGAAR